MISEEDIFHEKKKKRNCWSCPFLTKCRSAFNLLSDWQVEKRKVFYSYENSRLYICISRKHEKKEKKEIIRMILFIRVFWCCQVKRVVNCIVDTKNVCVSVWIFTVNVILGMIIEWILCANLLIRYTGFVEVVNFTYPPFVKQYYLLVVICVDSAVMHYLLLTTAGDLTVCIRMCNLF